MLTFQETKPEELGIPSTAIQAMIERLMKKEVPMHSLILFYRDKLIAQGYYAPYQKDSLHRMFSITKSMTAIAIGLLQDEGKLNIMEPIISYFPEYRKEDTHPWVLEMTIRDMLMMRTCHASTTYKLDMKSDWVESFFTVTPTHKPGTVFHYDTSSAHTLCALVEKLSGMDLLDYLKEKLSELGLSKESYALKDPFGVTIGGSGMVCTSMDLLKIGYFLLREGNINGKQLLSKEYIKEATSCLTATKVTGPLPSEACGYGYQIWQNEQGGFVLYGMGGQLVIVLPQYDLICVTTADTQGMAGGNQLIYDALYEEVLPYIKEAAKENFPDSCKKSETEFLAKKQKEVFLQEKGKLDLKQNAEGMISLKETLASLQVKPLKNPLKTVTQESVKEKMIQKIQKLQKDITGKTYVFAKNSQGFESCSFTFGETNVFRYVLRGKKCELCFGFEKLVCGNFPIYEKKYGASGCWLDEKTLYLRFHIMDDYVGSVHMEFYFEKDTVTAFFKKVEESLFAEYNCHLYGEAK